MKPAFQVQVLTVAVAMAFTACKRENDIPVITVSPSQPVVNALSGNVVSFGVRGVSDGSTLSRLIITSKRENTFTTTIKDTVLSGGEFLWTMEYVVAHSTEPYSELLTFDLYEADGDHMATKRTLSVALGATLLTESSGHTFYSRNSVVHPESAFDLQARIPVIFSVDSTRRDIQDNPTGAPEDLSRSWISPADGRLVRYNGYDYANATDISLRNAFDTGIPVEQLNNVAVGDIILVKLGSLPVDTSYYSAIRVIDVVDEPGTADNDRYIFNMKWAVFTE